MKGPEPGSPAFPTTSGFSMRKQFRGLKKCSRTVSLYCMGQLRLGGYPSTDRRRSGPPVEDRVDPAEIALGDIRRTSVDAATKCARLLGARIVLVERDHELGPLEERREDLARSRALAQGGGARPRRLCPDAPVREREGRVVHAREERKDVPLAHVSPEERDVPRSGEAEASEELLSVSRSVERGPRVESCDLASAVVAAHGLTRFVVAHEDEPGALDGPLLDLGPVELLPRQPVLPPQDLGLLERENEREPAPGGERLSDEPPERPLSNDRFDFELRGELGEGRVECGGFRDARVRARSLPERA